ncbi:MAG: beta-ribofuranosylaminobenzene 5-phosphate synthase [Methanothermococcus sp.]|jgi:beta-ribofuranosylaminobenzene 5'-phosphate synthase|uniref:beta-ribofuranosylaminobenzene 5'-phosphate synthase n=1 Tax=Methanothermococcus TaxID=155862 RepID=UPI00036D0589|nr:MULTISPECIES: beta-ribofuranosylaminobenzene 5'-phosphate synthase [Methanothermococcus]MDK2790031.1 beta-ribofuranosylaminobenzene 5-phosphate synthase [Methanothermococcus sp.]
MKLKLTSPSRIHMSLIDLNGSIGRVDGGVGVALDYPNFVIEGKESDEIEIDLKADLNKSMKEDMEKRIYDSAKKVLNHINEDGISLKIRNIIPPHTGLGSGTQMAISTGKLTSLIYGKELSATEIAKITGRGGTSGIGIAAFENGGFIVDGGHTFGPGKDKEDFRPSSVSKNVRPAPILFRHDFNWDIVLTIPRGKNIHGNKEVDIFKTYCPIPLSETQKLCHLILMKMMPSIIEKDLNSFGEVINNIQNLGFKKVEVDLQSETVKKLLKTLQDVSYSGLSSFGPTIYSIGDKKIIIEASKKFFDENGIEGEIIVTTGNNKGYKVE